MNYPAWVLDAFGGGTLIAIIAIVHVYVAHFAVGGGLFLVLTERKGLREKSEEILSYTKRHARFFLLLSMVFGGLTGVAIWFTIALLSPGATSSLIHIFVFGWAIEWVFFLGEIVSLLLYYYYFNKISSKNHLILGWIYFACAWMSLFVINGIIDFMLTPGNWLENHSFWSGFFNPTFWPALFFRTFLALIIAGLFGFLTSVNIKSGEFRNNMVRYCGRWLLIPLILLLFSAMWYKGALPPAQKEMIFIKSPELKPFISLFSILSPILFAGGLLIACFRPQAVRRPLAWILLLLGFLYMGSFEFIREGGRRPYIIHNYMYSNSILKSSMPAVKEQGFLQTARWVKNREITSLNRTAAGKELFTMLCLPCHSEGGMLNNMLPLARRYSTEGMRATIAGMGSANSYMPPFPGNNEEAQVLAEYITMTMIPGFKSSPIFGKERNFAVVEFNPAEAAYVLLAGPTMGEYISSSPSATGIDFSYGTPVIRAQLIQRAESPVMINEASISYKLSDNLGILEGTMAAAAGYFETILPRPIELSPSADPFVIAHLKATVDGETVAETDVKIGIFNNVGCQNCHGENWPENILFAHDKRSGTSLLDIKNSNAIITCSECHADVTRNSAGKPGLLTLSSSIHGFHAGYLSAEENNCSLCHPSGDNIAGHSFDGIHKGLGLTCSNCHGTMAEHATALLKEEGENGNAGRLLSFIIDNGTTNTEVIKPRRPWAMEPDCLTCHVNFEPPETDNAFNQWTEGSDGLFSNRKGEIGTVLCTSCHGQAHSLYPAANSYGKVIGALQPMQYQGNIYPIAADRNCAVCHTIEMEDAMHHPGSLAKFRNRQ